MKEPTPLEYYGELADTIDNLTLRIEQLQAERSPLLSSLARIAARLTDAEWIEERTRRAERLDGGRARMEGERNGRSF